MFRLEIHAGGSILAEYEGQDDQMLLDNARTDGWIDWYFGEDYVITEDAWKNDGVDLVLLYEGWDKEFNDKDVIMEIREMENLEEEYMVEDE